MRDSGLFDGALKVGEPLPPFRLPNSAGRLVEARDLLARGPLVVSFINRLGSADFFLPIPAVFIADRSGIVRLSYIEPDYQKRLEPTAILETLKRMAD